MAKNLFEPETQRSILERIDSLGPGTQRQWGTLSLPKALCHMADQLSAALGDLEVRKIRGFTQWPIVRWMVVHALPVPKGVRTAPGLLQTDHVELEDARQHLRQTIEKFVANGQDGDWAPHPAFGALTGREWGKLAWKHLDHHLRQFGSRADGSRAAST